MSAKNCHTCEHLEWEPGDEYGSHSGWVCERRAPVTAKAEDKLIKNMAREVYRNRYKRCFEAKAATQTTEGADK